MKPKLASIKLTASRYLYFLFSSFIHLPLLILFLFGVASLLVLSSSCSLLKQKPAMEVAEPPFKAEVLAASEYMEQGSESFEHGAFEKAISNWTEAARLYEQEGDTNSQVEALIKLSQAYQSVGQAGQAIETLEKALILAKGADDQPQIASVLGHIGNIYIGVGQMDTAHQYLNEGLAMARHLGDSNLEAIILNNLGNLFTAQKRYDEALSAYRESVMLSHKATNHTMAAVALTNAAIVSERNGQYEETISLLDRALNEIRSTDDSYYKAYGLINVGLAYHDLCPHLSYAKETLLNQASTTLTEAFMVAEKISDLRTGSYALGYLGKIYEDEHQYQDALQLTRRAIFAAQQVNAPESLYRWHWQAGRLLKVLGEIDDAISAYRLSVYYLQAIRQEMSTCYTNPESSFRRIAGDVCFELVDLLLQRAATFREPEKYESLLFEAREVVELLKVFELRDYFKDDCVDAGRSMTTRLDTVSQTAVVIYPIVLKDRTELLVSLPTGLKRYSVQVGEDIIAQEVRGFRHKLEKRTTKEFLPHAQKLYEWLVRPLEPDLASVAIDTLVFVPDGPLRMIPMAALHDGKQFLISKYALAITPGLDLSDPRPIQREKVKVLAAGLTEPTQGFPPLPYVSSELQTIQSLYPAELLLNQDFLISSIENALRTEPFTVLHIASHGQFEREVKDTFILTFDERLTMDRLDQYVGLLRFRDDPLELLTLSACDTAVGDDQAALGLAGVAVKAGARSALATLWYINDVASSFLVGEFYRQLQNPSVSRAVALQRAQLKMLNDRRYEHPGYWSPFLLINNWL